MLGQGVTSSQFQFLVPEYLSIWVGEEKWILLNDALGIFLLASMVNTYVICYSSSMSIYWGTPPSTSIYWASVGNLKYKAGLCGRVMWEVPQYSSSHEQCQLSSHGTRRSCVGGRGLGLGERKNSAETLMLSEEYINWMCDWWNRKKYTKIRMAIEIKG